MSSIKKLMMSAASVDNGTNVEDLFYTYVYTGDGTTDRDIVNGLDLSGEGGLIWFKGRDVPQDHSLWDTERGDDQRLTTNSDNDQNLSDWITFQDNGFKLRNSASQINGSNNEYVNWSFRKAPKFFDVVTWTGNGETGTRQIPHNLGSTPGMIITKSYNTAGTDWFVWHTAIGDNAYIRLNSNIAQITRSNWLSCDASNITISDWVSLNGSGRNIVAYLFANNDGDGGFGPDEDQDIIKCGGYTGIGSALKITLGFEPQLVLIKNRSDTQAWNLMDTKRGVEYDGDGDYYLRPNLSSAENPSTFINILSDGFEVNGGSNVGALDDLYLYMAIRFGPMVTPTNVDDLFDVTAYTADNTDGRIITTSNQVDMVMARARSATSANGFLITDRFMEPLYHHLGSATSDGKSAQDGDSYQGLDFEDAFGVGNDATGRLNYLTYTEIAYTWSRAPKFFDLLYYEGDETAGRTITHNLTVAPEMIWVKRTDGTASWAVYHSDISNNGSINLNTSAAADSSDTSFNNTAPTSSVFTVGGDLPTNLQGGTYVAYLFASLSGISKVGSYTGNGTNQNIDCGFSSGARFILIKRTDDTGDWCVYDTARGIVSGDDKRLELNTTDVEDTNTDSIDPYSAGFNVVQESEANLNVNSATYIFYAIA